MTTEKLGEPLRERRARRIDDIDVMPWAGFLDALWADQFR
jgi:hypothetical protein